MGDGAEIDRCPSGSCARAAGEERHPASIHEQFVKTRLKKCSATTECPPGLVRAEMFGSASPPFGGLSVSRSVPVACFDDDGWHCSLQSGCRDAKTLLVPFSWAKNRVCGSERVPCPNGCDEGGPDAGWVPARCKP